MGRRGRNSRKETYVKERLWRIAIYIRLSKEDGNDVSKSVENQKAMILEYVSSLEDAYEIFDTYIDDGCTGTDTERDGFQRMLKAIREHKVNCVIVKDLSRLSRNLADATYHLENTFVEYDIRFISLELPTLDSYKYPEQMNSIAVPMQNVINDDFCRQTSIKIRGVFNNKRRNGQFIGAFAPYGYLKNPEDKHSFIVDEEAAAVVRDIYKWFVNEGLSKGAIVRKLNSMGIPNPAAYKKQTGSKYCNPKSIENNGLWTTKTVYDMLSNMMYLGHMVQGKYRIKSYKVHTQISTPKEEWFIVENTHDAIIEQELFDKAQKLHQQDTRTAPKERALYLLSGYVRCGDCGKAMIRTSSSGKGKKQFTYYKCRTYTRQSKEVCTPHTIRAEMLEEAVFNTTKQQIQLVDSLREAVEKINQSPNARNESQRLIAMQRARETELEKVTQIKDGLFKDWKNGDITQQEYRRYKEEYEQETERLTEIINNLKAEQRMMAEGVNCDNLYLSTFSKYSKIQTLERRMVVDLIENIHVFADGEIKIDFTYADQYKMILDFIASNTHDLRLVTAG